MSWANDAVFYHIYPLGALGAPPDNDRCSAPTDRLSRLHGWLDHIAALGANALCLGPVFESSRHGYDTIDYNVVDRRLGDNDALAAFVRACHDRGIRVVLDAVLNHTGRDFFAFQDVLANGERSEYRDWFHIDFSRPGPGGIPFDYHGWGGGEDLVKLNHSHWAVREHLFGAVRGWFERFGIDGLRLDAAVDMDIGFQRDLGALCRELRRDAWLLGEVVAGDFRRWAHWDALDSVTNYPLYKALFSSHNDKNYFELAYTLDHQSGAGGDYRELKLYTFADNHDVDRVASSLRDPAHLFPLYGLLFTVPGIPSIYYGSEFGLTGARGHNTDVALRPEFDPRDPHATQAGYELLSAIRRFAALRHRHPALRHGDYTQLYVSSEQLAFQRAHDGERLVVVANASDRATTLRLWLPGATGSLVDLLDNGPPIPVSDNHASVPLHPAWTSVFRLAP